jgi:hypothetical protein
MSVVGDPLHGVNLKLDRAAHHLDRIKAEVAAYTQDRPYVPVIEDQAALDEILANWPQLTRAQHATHLLATLPIVVGEVRPISEIIPIVLGDFLHNLRSSLDHLAVQLVKLNPPQAREPKPPRDKKPKKRTRMAFPIKGPDTDFPRDSETGFP